MKKKFLIFTVFLSGFVFAQEKIGYKSMNGDIDFEISKEQFYVKTSEKDKFFQEGEKDRTAIKLSDNTAILVIKGLSGGFASQKKSIMVGKGARYEKIEPVLIYKDGIRQIANGDINIKIKPGVDIQTVIEGWKFVVEADEFDKTLFLLKSDYDTDEIFKIVEKLEHNGQIEFVEPNFIKMLKPSTSDPYFNAQWSLKNTGQRGGRSGADMKVVSAWSYSTGKGIKVAVIDEGVDLRHPDLRGNLLPGYDATGYGSAGAPSNNDAHGTAAAGIVAAVGNNNIGVVGVAYNAKIIPIRIAYQVQGRDGWVTSDTWMARGIDWAWRNGADVLSNSWGGGSPSSAINNAINNAFNYGRSGKGSVILFAAGNGNTSTVSYPASLPTVISVGATSMCDQRKSPSSCDGETTWGSDYGVNLDIAAPGVKIYTTDISGSRGYEQGDYTPTFNGTSAACPNAAGVAALVLSANSQLTQREVRNILERNTDKVRPDLYAYGNQYNRPNGTWNNQLGYGRVNALKAVQAANSSGSRARNVSIDDNVDQYKVVSGVNNPNLYQVVQLQKVDLGEVRSQSVVQNSQKYQIKVVNLLGNVLISQSGSHFDVASLPTGTYVVQVFLEKSLVVSQTIVKK